MKSLYITFTDSEIKKLKRKKRILGLNWHDAIIWSFELWDGTAERG